MKPRIGRALMITTLLGLASLALSQEPGFPEVGPRSQGDVRLPSGKSQRDEILKAEHAQNVKDASRLAELADQLKEDIEKDDRFVLSISTLKKTDEIEKLAKKIRSRLHH